MNGRQPTEEEQKLIAKAWRKAKEFQEIRSTTSALMFVLAVMSALQVASLLWGDHQKRKSHVIILGAELLANASFLFPLLHSRKKAREWERFAHHVEQLARSEAGSLKALSEAEQLFTVMQHIDKTYKPPEIP